MFNSSHLSIAAAMGIVLIKIGFGEYMAPVAIMVFMFSAIVPDLDMTVGGNEAHRRGTHTVAFAALWGAFVTTVIYWLAPLFDVRPAIALMFFVFVISALHRWRNPAYSMRMYYWSLFIAVWICAEFRGFESAALGQVPTPDILFVLCFLGVLLHIVCDLLVYGVGTHAMRVFWPHRAKFGDPSKGGALGKVGGITERLLFALSTGSLVMVIGFWGKYFPGVLSWTAGGDPEAAFGLLFLLAVVVGVGALMTSRPRVPPEALYPGYAPPGRPGPPRAPPKRH